MELLKDGSPAGDKRHGREGPNGSGGPRDSEGDEAEWSGVRTLTSSLYSVCTASFMKPL